MKINHFYTRTNRKPDRKVLGAGTFFLFDTANLLASTGYRRAARTLEVISGDLTSQGYRAVFFLERRSYNYARGQGSLQDAAMLKAFAMRRDVVLIEEALGGERSESDDAMLQIAEVLPNSVCISNDRFRDYAAIHPGIVKSDRVRGYNLARIDDKMYITIPGLKRAVVINDMGSESASAAVRSVPEVKAPPVCVEANADEYAPCMVAAGARRQGGKPSRRRLAAIRNTASHRGDDDWDSRLLLDAKMEARRIHSARRSARLRARAIREGSWRFAHFSRKRREAAGIAALGAQLGYGRIA